MGRLEKKLIFSTGKLPSSHSILKFIVSPFINKKNAIHRWFQPGGNDFGRKKLNRKSGINPFIRIL